MNPHNFRHNWQRKKIIDSKRHQYKAFEEVNEIIICARHAKKIILADSTELIEFISCSYLGLDQHEQVIKAATNNIFECGVTFSSARTRVLFESFIVLESLLNKIFYDAYSVVFASVHLAHLGVLPLIASGELPSFPLNDHGPLFIMDVSVHASIQINRGLLQQFGDIVFVNIHDSAEVERSFQSACEAKKTPIVLADGVGSMGGTSHVVELLSMAEQYKGYIYLDDAHGTSIYGKNGCGYVLNCLNVFHPRLILTASLAKAFGTVGGVVILPTAEDAKMVKRYASTYVFGGPPPLAIIDSAIASAYIHLSQDIDHLQRALQINIRQFDTAMGTNHSERIINYSTTFPIRGVLIGDEFKTIESTSILREKGFALTTALYPTVPKGKGMLRMGICANHTLDDIQHLCNHLNEILDDN